jgi:hypothetical protein
MSQQLSKSEQKRLAAMQESKSPHPDEKRDLPAVAGSTEAPNPDHIASEVVTETPGSVPLVKKNRIEVPEVSRIGEKTRP